MFFVRAVFSRVKTEALPHTIWVEQGSACQPQTGVNYSYRDISVAPQAFLQSILIMELRDMNVAVRPGRPAGCP